MPQPSQPEDPKHARQRSDAPLLELTHARVVRDGRTILHVDHLTLRSGERVAILGPNGAGKSTLVGLLTRDVRALAPQDTDAPAPVRLLGEPLWDLVDARRLLGVVSASLQSTYDLPVTVRDAVLSGFFGSIGLRQTHRPTAEQIDRADQLLAEVGATELADRLLDTLSTGEARRALVARALANDPQVARARRALRRSRPRDDVAVPRTHGASPGALGPDAAAGHAPCGRHRPRGRPRGAALGGPGSRRRAKVGDTDSRPPLSALWLSGAGRGTRRVVPPLVGG